MTSLDYATVYETQFRGRRRLRRALLGLSALCIAAVPMTVVLLSHLG